MHKLVDYFVVVGYEQHPVSGGAQLSTALDSLDESDGYYLQSQARLGARAPMLQGRAKIIQRFPDGAGVDDADDESGFDANITSFCQPHKGWRLYARQEAPTYFVSVLTDIKGQRRLAACLTFLEPFAESPPPHPVVASVSNVSSSKDPSADSASSDLSDSDDLAIVRVKFCFVLLFGI